MPACNMAFLLMMCLGCAPTAALDAASLMDCFDGGPWPCNEDGCPAEALSCEMLANDGLCTQAFGDFFEAPPPGFATEVVRNVCPRACGRCGVPAPDICSMPKIDAQALSAEALAQALVNASGPVVVQGAMGAWTTTRSTCWTHPGLLDAHGAFATKVIVEGGRVRGEATEEVLVPMRDYPLAMRNGSLPDAAYVFMDVQDELPCDDLFHIVPRSYALKGRLILSMGSWGNGRPFHAHGPALFGLIAGVKRWFIRRPNATFAWQRYEAARREDLRESEELPEGWADQVWQCTQQPGELLWVPDMMQHSTLNYAAETVGFAMVIDELHPATPLHKAAQSGSAAAVRTLLKQGADVSATAMGGATALHHAVGLGHCDVAQALLDGGADVDARAQMANDVTPLHAAAAAGHAKAVALLLRRGASIEHRDANGHTALELAKELGHSSVVRVMERK